MSDNEITLASDAALDAVAVDAELAPEASSSILAPAPAPVPAPTPIDILTPWRAQVAALTLQVETLRGELATVTGMLSLLCSGSPIPEDYYDIVAWWAPRVAAYTAQCADLKTTALAKLTARDKQILGV